MNDKELNIAINLIIDTLDKSNLSIETKTELMLNIREFLKPKNYKENIKVLEKHYEKKR